jgi:hypothetical protein
VIGRPLPRICADAPRIRTNLAIGRLSVEGDLWSGTVRASTRARPVFFCVADFGERCKEKEAWILRISLNRVVLPKIDAFSSTSKERVARHQQGLWGPFLIK